MLLASYWVFLVPIFQSPDEDCHADYLFSLYSKQRLFKATDWPIVGCSHPYTRYLFDATNGQAVKIIAYAQPPLGYGTKSFFHKIDVNAPTEQMVLQCKTNPGDTVIYPFVYYAIAAIWLKLLSCFDSNLCFLFFSARFLSVILLGCGLTFSYLTMLELGLSRLKATLILAAIAFFPMVTFVGSYIQPDNLSLAVVSACFYLALRWRNTNLSNQFTSNLMPIPLTIKSYLRDVPLFRIEEPILWLLGLIMGLLLVKYQIFLCVGTAILAMVITKSIRSKISFKQLVIRLLILLGPAMAIGIIQTWIIWGSGLPSIDRQHWHWHPTYTAFKEALNGHKILTAHIVNALLQAYHCIYCIDGLAFHTFWGCFGHVTVPLIIVNPTVNQVLRIIINWLTKIIILLTLVSLAKVSMSLFLLSKKRGIRCTLYLACSNIVINSYLLFVIFMFLFFVVAYPSVLWQGRHWYALIFALFITAACFAPRVLVSRVIRERIFFLITIGWLCYSLIGSYSAIACIRERFYSTVDQPIINIEHLKTASINAPNWIDWSEYLDRYPTFDQHPKHDINSLVVPRGTDIWIQGKALDINANSLAAAVFLYIDNVKMYRAIYGVKRPYKKDEFHFDDFGILIPTKELSLGTHWLTMKFVSADGRILYSTKQCIKVLVN